MKEYERKVRHFLKSLDDFFETRGMNAEDIQKQVGWFNAYHAKLDRERYDKAEKLQKTLF